MCHGSPSFRFHSVLIKAPAGAASGEETTYSPSQAYLLCLSWSTAGHVLSVAAAEVWARLLQHGGMEGHSAAGTHQRCLYQRLFVLFSLGLSSSCGFKCPRKVLPSAPAATPAPKTTSEKIVQVVPHADSAIAGFSLYVQEAVSELTRAKSAKQLEQREVERISREKELGLVRPRSCFSSSLLSCFHPVIQASQLRAMAHLLRAVNMSAAFRC
jgi:hypothetical protein